jgi:8-oxo-dGTP pyrophosphatase MutT (NUDIX family)
MGAEALAEVRNLVEGVRPLDGLEEEHRSQVLCWLSRTDDVFRRVKPRTPDQHLVSYFLVVDPQGPYVLLGDHIKAGRWLPTGGHVEPDESPVDTVRREVWEELGIQARFPSLGQISRLPVKTAVLTNGTDEQQHAKLKAVGLEGRFGHVFTAERLGAAKPDLSTYRHVCEVLNVDVGSALHVGDSHALDVAAPREAGLHAVHLDRAGAGPSDEPARIRSLRELPAFCIAPDSNGR